MSTETFYATVTTVSFTLLGLWGVVVQARPEWRRSGPEHALAYVGLLHFVLPGAMAILAIAAPDVRLLWRLAFSLAGVTGIVGTLLLARALQAGGAGRRVVAIAQWIGVPIYAAILAFAAVPDLPSYLGMAVTALQVEAVIVALLLVFGVLSAWLVLVEASPAEDADVR